MNLGGGGECPLLLVGIEPERVDGIEVVADVRDQLAVANDELKNWRERFASYREAQAQAKIRKTNALERLPPLGDD